MMFVKLIDKLKNFHQIPFKVFNKIKFNYYKHFGEKKILIDKQIECFSKLHLNWIEGKKKLEKIKKKFHIPFREMSSEHEIIFSSISLNQMYQIRNILEIGTHDGINAFLLSKIFSNAKIVTIDLNHKDNDFIKFYNRKNEINEFVNKRDNFLKKSENINFIQMNSLELINHERTYDLIWIDGAHGYPMVCIDIINSLRLSDKSGIILCDDVYINRNQDISDEMYKSNATYETLNVLKKQNLIDYRLIYKRIRPEYNCIENEKKYIAFCNKK